MSDKIKMFIVATILMVAGYFTGDLNLIVSIILFLAALYFWGAGTNSKD